MGVFDRSWQLTKLSFGVIRQDKEMLLFPVLAGFFSLAYSAALLVPTVVVKLTHSGAHGAGARGALSALDWALCFVTYLGLAFIATFFNVCAVYTSKKRFEGGDATFGESIRFALSRVPRIFSWSLLAATVGLLLTALDNAAERAGGIGKLLLSILRGILGGLWSVITIFVVPAMVYEDLGPIDAIKSSIGTLRRTWGENLVRHFGLGLIQFLFIALGVLMTIGVVVVMAPLGGPLLLIGVVAMIVYFIGVVLVFSVANTVFVTALYAYANGSQPPGFDRDLLARALGPRG